MDWVKTKDRLPGKNEVVLAFAPSMRESGTPMQTICGWSLKARSEIFTHWMPLPEEPKEE